MVVWFWAQANFNTAPAASKNDSPFKSGHNWLKNSHLDLLIKICDTLCISAKKTFTNKFFTNATTLQQSRFFDPCLQNLSTFVQTLRTDESWT